MRKKIDRIVHLVARNTSYAKVYLGPVDFLRCGKVMLKIRKRSEKMHFGYVLKKIEICEFWYFRYLKISPKFSPYLKALVCKFSCRLQITRWRTINFNFGEKKRYELSFQPNNCLNAVPTLKSIDFFKGIIIRHAVFFHYNVFKHGEYDSE